MRGKWLINETTVETVVLLNNKFAKAKDFVQIGIDAEEYFDLEKTGSTDSFSVKMVKKKFDTPVRETINYGLQHQNIRKNVEPA